MIQFKNIPDYENYIASSDGRIFNTNYRRTGKTVEMSQYINQGYCDVCLSKNGKGKTHRVHLLVMRAFYGYKPDDRKIVVNHINNNKLNNSIDNLEVVTNRYNSSCHQYLNTKKTSKFVGVNFVKSSSNWRAAIWFGDEQRSLGFFNSEIDARNEYLRALNEIETFSTLTILSPAAKRKTSKYKGVSYSSDKRKWIAQGHINGKNTRLGAFDSEIDAFNCRKNFEKNNIISYYAAKKSNL